MTTGKLYRLVSFTLVIFFANAIIKGAASQDNNMDRKVNDFGAACQDLNVFLPLVTPFTEVVESRARRNFSRGEGEPPSNSVQVNQGYDLLGAGYEFLEQELGMNSLDNRGMTLNLYVKVKYDQTSIFSGVQCLGNAFNASWIPSKQSLYLHEDAIDYPEIIMHELTHGIISNGSNLEYQFQSGALNESIADAIGVTFRTWLEYGNKTSKVGTLPSDIWYIRGPSGVMRDMSNPGRISAEGYSLPSHMTEFIALPLETNNGGVHLNSSIMNMGFYLLANGGKHPTYPNHETIEGIGLFPAARIFTLAASNLLFSQASFQDARFSFAQAATILFGENSSEWVSVHKAMDAIGITGDWTMPESAQEPEVKTSKEDPQQTETNRPAQTSEPEPLPQTPADKLDETETEPLKETNKEGRPEDVNEKENEHEKEDYDTSKLSEKQKQIILIAALTLTGILLAIFAIIKLKLSYRKEYAAKNQEVRVPSHKAQVPFGQKQQHKHKHKHDSDYDYFLQHTNGEQSLPLNRGLLLSKEGLIVGRSAQIVHVQIANSTVSRRHLRFALEKEQLTIEDLNSTLGTFLDGKPLHPFKKVQVYENQIIKLDKFAYILKRK